MLRSGLSGETDNADGIDSALATGAGLGDMGAAAGAGAEDGVVAEGVEDDCGGDATG
jgi:hypothetical protein